MITIRNKHFTKFADNKHTSVIRAEIDVDTVNELPETDGIPGNILHQGSIAYVIKSGEFYVLASDGKWYNSKAEI